MRSKISIILLFISVALLIIYAADVLSSKRTPTPNVSSSGFLQLNESVRGAGLGGSAVVLSIIAFALSPKERSNLIVLLLLINGGLIAGGMIALYFQDSQGTTKGNLQTIFGTMGLGFLLIALGIVKIVMTRARSGQS